MTEPAQPLDLDSVTLDVLFRIATRPVYVFRSRWSIGGSITPETLTRLLNAGLVTMSDHEPGRGRRLIATDGARGALYSAVAAGTRHAVGV